MMTLITDRNDGINDKSDYDDEYRDYNVGNSSSNNESGNDDDADDGEGVTTNKLTQECGRRCALCFFPIGYFFVGRVWVLRCH